MNHSAEEEASSPRAALESSPVYGIVSIPTSTTPRSRSNSSSRPNTAMLYPGLLYWLTFVMAIYTRGVIDGLAASLLCPGIIGH